jgi:hypothetical protein
VLLWAIFISRRGVADWEEWNGINGKRNGGGAMAGSVGWERRFFYCVSVFVEEEGDWKKKTTYEV